MDLGFIIPTCCREDVHLRQLHRCINSIRKFYLNKHIPFYMIPKKFYFIKKFPLNKSGKLDRKNILKLYQ